MDKLEFVTVDNASSNDVAILRLSCVLKDRSKNPPLLKCKLIHVRCAAHVINLIVKDWLKEISEAITRLCESVQYIKSTPSRKQGFQEAINLSHMSNQARPSVDFPTRWNSTYLMLKSPIPYKKAFEILSDQDANFSVCLSTDHWKEIKVMESFLSIFNTGIQYHLIHFPSQWQYKLTELLSI
jgi:hypothetical protein